MTGPGTIQDVSSVSRRFSSQQRKKIIRDIKHLPFHGKFGGKSAAARNVISGHSGDGVGIQVAGATGNVVAGDYIGTDVTGGAPLGNVASGVLNNNGAPGNTIGGTLAAARNVIPDDPPDGVAIIVGRAGGPGRSRRREGLVGAV
jgi:hypothetical protein